MCAYRPMPLETKIVPELIQGTTVYITLGRWENGWSIKSVNIPGKVSHTESDKTFPTEAEAIAAALVEAASLIGPVEVKKRRRDRGWD